MRKLWDNIKNGGGAEPSTFRAGLWIFAGVYLFYLAYSVLKELIAQTPGNVELILKILFILLFIAVGFFFALTGFFTMKRSLKKVNEGKTELELSEEDQITKEESTSDFDDK